MYDFSDGLCNWRLLLGVPDANSFQVLEESRETNGCACNKCNRRTFGFALHHMQCVEDGSHSSDFTVVDMSNDQETGCFSPATRITREDGDLCRLFNEKTATGDAFKQLRELALVCFVPKRTHAV